MTIARSTPLAPEELEARVEARWRQMLEEQPDLGPVVDLQRTMVRALMASDRALAARGPASLPPTDRLIANLRSALPALAGERSYVPADILGPLVAQLTDDLAAGGAGDAAARIGEAVRARRLEAHSIIAASLLRDTCAFRMAADQLGLAPDLLWLVGEMAASPLAHALAQAVFETADDNLRSALGAWRHGYCPVCGSWPAIGEIRGGERCLRCSFCAAGWHAAQAACIYCGHAEGFSVVTVDPAKAEWRLELCSACGGYFKLAEVRTPLDFPLQALEDLATSTLDTAALERGFHRPAIVERLRAEPATAEPR